jgi:Ser/Thr protein kinase RdoA (MazF antagonist)
MHSTHPFDALKPDLILDAVESLGLRTDGRLLALNSYENRVYQVGIEDGTPVVAKFYRPQRWSDAAILEEHAFCAALVEAELPAVPPLVFAGKSLHEHAEFRFSLFPRRGGRLITIDDAEHRRWIGRLLARLHGVGARQRFAHRPTLTVADFGEASAAFLLEHQVIPAHIEEAYRSLSRDLLQAVGEIMAGIHPALLRIHGDCHAGNILWTDEGPHFVDFDDARMGPAIQDLWMLLSGERGEQERQLAEVLEGYEQFRSFDYTEVGLIEALRTLRLMHYEAWVARRWDDPAFPQAFPWFDSPRHWEDHVLALREQLALLHEPPLAP